ncbi:MAG TPA: adenylate/guanylate cyclase domain-containing protein [Terriglobales bacterium]|jgi:class 3 adenylate cyclase/pSer/pThr/pTyr-binding forkhead associated (FHA) protein|nr:adenylate/guanylate cyclase domain-containing protein [Terriglobales bacterium]
MQANSVTQIIQASRGNNQLLAELEKFRRTITVMFTDIKGSTAYFEKYGDAAGLMMVHQCNDSLRQIVEGHGGRVVKTIGDAIMATFEDCKESVLASIEMQKALIGFNAPKPEQDHVFIRIGLNYGQGIVKSNDVFGDVVNVASRVESVAAAEQIVISDSVYEQIKDLKLFKTASLGKFSLKGKEGDRDLYEVEWTPKKETRTPVAHTIMMEPPKASRVVPHFKLQHIKKDGTSGELYEMKQGRLSLGRSQGDLQYATDGTLAPLHARFYVENGQLLVEDLSDGKGVFVRLIATYTLQDGDAVLMGKQLLLFREKSEAVAAAAATGTSVGDLSQMIQEPVAEFVRLTPQGVDNTLRFPLLEQEITWGRNKGTYIFPDDGFMSRAHAKIYQRGENYFLEDLGSRNGTFIKVRGKTPVPLGAMVLAGGQLLKVMQ